MKSRWLLLLAFIGLALIGIGIYTLIKKPDPPAQANTPSLPANTRLLKEGVFPVTQAWTSVGRYRGRIFVTVSGSATLNSTWTPLGPDGADRIAPSFFTLPGVNIFCALARHEGTVEKVGNYREIFLENETELFLGVNEDLNKRDGPGLDDNRGEWSYRILTPVQALCFVLSAVFVGCRPNSQ